MHQRVLIMGSTNRKDAIDEAFLRRMPLQIHVGLPNHKQRVQLLEHFLRGTPVTKSLDTVELAHLMEGFSGSVMQDCCKDACLQPVDEAMNFAARSESNHSSLQMEIRPVAFSDFFTNGMLHHAHRIPGTRFKSTRSALLSMRNLLILCIVIGLFLAWLLGGSLFRSIIPTTWSLHKTLAVLSYWWPRVVANLSWFLHEAFILFKMLWRVSTIIAGWLWHKTLASLDALWSSTTTTITTPTNETVPVYDVSLTDDWLLPLRCVWFLVNLPRTLISVILGIPYSLLFVILSIPRALFSVVLGIPRSLLFVVLASFEYLWVMIKLCGLLLSGILLSFLPPNCPNPTTTKVSCLFTLIWLWVLNGVSTICLGLTFSTLNASCAAIALFFFFQFWINAS